MAVPNSCTTLNTVLSSRVSRVRVRVSVRFSGRYKNLGPPFIGLPKSLGLWKSGTLCQTIAPLT